MLKKNNLILSLQKLIAPALFSLTFGYAISDDSKPESQDSFINVCRPSSIIRHGQRPDILVNGVVVGDIQSGSVKKFTAKLGDKYSLKTHSNMFMFRFKDESLFENLVQTQEEIYLIVKGQLASPGAVVSQLFGGAIAESIRQNNTDTPSGDWTVEVVTQTIYESICSEIK
jgi:hypothetical protein